MFNVRTLSHLAHKILSPSPIRQLTSQYLGATLTAEAPNTQRQQAVLHTLRDPATRATTIRRHFTSQTADSATHLTLSAINPMKYGIDYDINPSQKSHLKGMDMALYTEAEITKQLAQANADAHQQVHAGPKKNNSPLIKHRPLDKLEIPIETCVTQPAVMLDQYQDSNTVIASAQGRRPTMEDTHAWSTIETTTNGQQHCFRISAIFDGHGGPECAHFSAKKIGSVLKTYLEKFNVDTHAPGPSTDCAMANALTHAVVHLSHSFNSKNPDLKQLGTGAFNAFAGSTLNLAIDTGKTVYFANLGDSRACFVSDEGAVQQLTQDHTLSCEKQRGRIFARGGYIQSQGSMHRVNGRLAVAAALGAHWTQGAISARPRITAFPTESLKTGTLIQACDGLFEVASTQQLGNRIHATLTHGMTLSEAANDAITAAWSCGSEDNLSLLLRKL